MLADGAVVLRGVFAAGSLTVLQEAATRCFEAIESDYAAAGRYGFNPYSHSVPLDALREFGCSAEEVLAPLAAGGIGDLFWGAMGGEWICQREHCWVRKKFAPSQAPLPQYRPQYRPQNWHQDGALGVRFPPEPGPLVPMTKLLTCWIPLNACGRESPGLELIRGAQAELLHFTELGDAALRERFPPERFRAPELAFGDGLVFLNSLLHRTYVRPEMTRNRVSVEYRIFPAS
jgi:hypothetical protein